ncbi:hypothetical protein GE21DRAFT_1211145 [Neurospora crassa]|nr:hypothetical protein GE21DRAFT_1211145 [Neurospora crassa]
MAEGGRKPCLLAGVRVGGLGRVTNPESTHQPASFWAHQAADWSTNTARLVGTFELGAKVSSHATSPIAFHLLVACGTQRLGARLVDLRSSAAVHSLVSHGQIDGSAAANLAVTWSLVQDHIVASGSADGVARLWNIRRNNLGTCALAKVHNGPVNGLTWTDDSAYIVSAGHNRQFSLATTIRNDYNGHLTIFVSPSRLTPQKKEFLFYPNKNGMLVTGLHEGTLIIRLRGMGPAVAATRQRGERTTRNFLSSTNVSDGIYSRHLDGHIRAWTPQLEALDKEDESTSIEDATGARVKKRKVLDDVFRTLMGRADLVLLKRCLVSSGAQLSTLVLAHLIMEDGVTRRSRFHKHEPSEPEIGEDRRLWSPTSSSREVHNETRDHADQISLWLFKSLLVLSPTALLLTDTPS